MKRQGIMFQTAEEKDKTQANNWMKWRYTIYQKKKKKERKKERKKVKIMIVKTI